MKREFKYLVVAICFLCTLISCSKTDIDSIFNGDNKDVIMPIESDNPEICDMNLSILNSVYVSEQILKKFNPELGEGQQYAAVINNSELLEGIEYGGEIIDFSGFNFEKYSIVLYHYGFQTRGLYYRQRILPIDDKLKLYAEFRPTFRGDLLLLSHSRYAVYPKLPSKDVEVVTWYNETAEPIL